MPLWGNFSGHHGGKNFSLKNKNLRRATKEIQNKKEKKQDFFTPHRT
jgi:hypothetical protein